MAWSTEISQLVTETQQFIDAVELNKPVLDAAANTAVQNAASALTSATEAIVIAAASTTSADVSKGHAAATEAIANLTKMQQDAVSDAERQASLAAGYALSAGSIVQQDLNGVTAAALHRSPNAITSMFIYDTSKDSDGGAWTEKCQNTSWYNEDITGKWLGAHVSEFQARHVGATVLASNFLTNADFSSGTTGWSLGASWAVSGAAAVATASSGNINQAMAGIVVGRSYLVEFDVTVSSGALRAELGGSIGPTVTSSGRYRAVLTSITGAYNVLYIYGPTAFTGSIDNISVREVTALNTSSNDYFQLTTDGKFYRLWKNLLSSSRDPFASVAGIVSKADAGITAPTGDQYVRITELSGTSSGKRFFSQNLTTFAGRMVFSFYAKENTGGRWISFRENTTTGFAFAFQPSTGTVSTYAGGASTSNVFVETVSAGVYRVSFMIDFTSAASRNLSLDIITGAGQSSLYAGDGVSGYDITSVQLEIGSTATTYEPKTTIGTTSEVFRGNKRDFPRLAGIVAEANNLTIYDLTEPGRPMWMRFVGGNPQNAISWANSSAAMSSAAAANGLLTVSSSWGGIVSSFLADDIRLIYGSNLSYALNARRISDRHATGSFVFFGSATPQAFDSHRVATNTLSAVAMTVLPDAPTDPVTGLKVPTIAVATSGGVSVIKHNGTVVNSSSNSSHISVSIDTYALVAGRSSGVAFIAMNPGSLGTGFSFENVLGTGDFRLNQSNKVFRHTRDRFAAINFGRVQLAKNSEAANSRGLAVTVAPTFNTGWMPGDIRRAYLSEAEVGSVTGSELVTNGAFDTDTGWTKSGGWSIASGIATYNNTPGEISQSVTLVANRTYRVSLDRTVISGSGNQFFLYLGAWQFANTYSASSGTFTFYVTAAVSGPQDFKIYSNAAAVMSFDNISIREVVADRSYKAQGAIINGTLTRAQVVSGTSLVGYSGFSATNYPQEPYSADLDFGTGEFSASAWVNIPTTVPNSAFPLIGSPITPNNLGASPWQTPLSGSISSNTWSGMNQYAVTTLSTTLNPAKLYRLRATATVSSGQFYWNIVGGSLIGLAAGTVDYIFTPTYSQIQLYSAVAGSITLTSIQIQEIGDSSIFNRSHTSGASISLGMNGGYRLTATAFDGTTTRTVTTTTAYNNAQWLKAEANYTTDGSLAIKVNGREVAVTRGTPLLTMNSRRNLLTWSEGFDNAAWTKLASTVTANAIAAPDGTTTADKIIATATTGEHGVYQNTSGTTGVIYVIAKAAEHTNIRIGEIGNYVFYASFNLTTGVASGTGGASFTSASTVDLGGGWWKCIITHTKTGGLPVSIGGFPTGATGFGFANFTGDGTSGIYVAQIQAEPGSVATDYQRVAATPETNVAPLTIGNSFATDAPFPGSIALLKLSATVPTAEQSTFMYEQEKQLFRTDAVSVLPDSTSIVDMSYDDATDRWSTVSATNESYWTGLVRNSVTPVPAGSYSKIATTSGVELNARITASPGVDVSIPTYLLREDLNKRAEAASKAFKEIVNFDYIGGFTASTTTGSTAITSVANLTYPVSPVGARISGSGIPTNTTITAVSGTTIYISAPATATATGVSITFLDFELPIGFEAEAVSSAGVIRREGSTADYTRLYDGFIETIRFAVAPGATAWVQIHASKII